MTCGNHVSCMDSSPKMEKTIDHAIFFGWDSNGDVGQLKNVIVHFADGSTPTGDFALIIDKFSEKKSRDAKLTSPKFQSDVYGFSLNDVCYPNGDGDGKGTHVSRRKQR